MPKSTVRVVTLGCSKNTVDTEHILYALRDVVEVVPADFAGRVDTVLINTCGFIGDAKEESIQAILEAVESKNRGEAGRIVVFGCLSQRYPVELKAEIPEVDAWFGARDFAPLLRELGAADSAAPLVGRVRTEPRPGSACIKISEGCDRRCSYCAIPLIRGAHRSVPQEQVVEEARRLAAEGVHELIVIAQDTTFYGLDLYGRRCLSELLQKLSEIEGVEWIRIHYSYPEGFPEDVITLMASNPKICPYLDIPLQHIADPVLSAMRRGSSSERTRALVKRLREQVPGVVLRTTMMVGHPGEGEAEFEELLSFVREARFERLGAFTYSEEEGTWGAQNLPDTVPQEEKVRRYNALMELQSTISLEFNESRVGSRERVLVDAFSDGVLVCRSRYESPDVDGEILVKYTPELFGAKAAEDLVGTFIDVQILGADEYDLIAEPVL